LSRGDLFVNQPSAIVHARSTSMLRSALGPAIAGWLDDTNVAEIMLNADGQLWVDRLDSGIAQTGEQLTPAQAERIIRLVAHHVGAEAHRTSPRVSAELPTSGERFEGLLPPVVTEPIFSIRRPASLPLALADYVASGVMTAMAATYLGNAVQTRANILVAGGTSTGKTTLTNALLGIAATSHDRIILIEDTRELRCDAANIVSLRTAPGVTMTDLVRSSLRLRPDRIPIGEVRGPEALDLLKAWGTGHPGGIGTIHAGTASAALHRLEQLILEAIPHVPRPLIAETIDVIAVLTGRGTERRLSELVRVEGFAADGSYRLLPILQPQGAIP
jgi:P-type conjugative transfer ATPase TrbB